MSQEHSQGYFFNYNQNTYETSDIQLSEYATCYEDVSITPKSPPSIYINTQHNLEPQDLTAFNSQTSDLHQVNSTIPDLTKTNSTIPNHFSAPNPFEHDLNVSSLHVPFEENCNTQHTLGNNCNDVFSEVSTQNYPAGLQFIDSNNTFVSPETNVPNMISANDASKFNFFNVSASHSDPSLTQIDSLQRFNNLILPLDKDKPFDVIEIICTLQNDVKNLRQEVSEMRQFISNSSYGFGVK